MAEQYAGTLSGFGDQDYFASAAGFQAAAGSHQGCLSGPDGVDFDLALEFLQGSFWVQVASSQGLTADERLTYDGEAGMYRWRVYVWGGSGSYNFGMQRP